MSGTLMLSKLCDVTIALGDAVSPTMQGAETVLDAEYLLIFAPQSEPRGNGLDESLTYGIEIAPDLSSTTTSEADTSANDFRTLVDSTGTPVELPAEDTCKVYLNTAWSSFRFAVYDNTGAYDQVGWDTTFVVFKAYRA